jgi:hypothetical protein
MLRRFVAACICGVAIATAGVWAFASPPKEGFAADPPAHSSEKQWVFDVVYDKGASSIASARSATAKKPIATPRQMGRFALEFWVGKELLDRVRFDVPLLGDDEGERDPKRPFKKPTFSRVTAKLKIQMADHPRATILAFVDRSTGETRRYFWPPDEKGQLTYFSAKAALTGDAIAPAAPTASGSAISSAAPSGSAAPAGSASAAPAGSVGVAPAAASATPSASASASAAPGGSAAPPAASTAAPKATGSASPSAAPKGSAPTAPTSPPAAPRGSAAPNPGDPARR